MSKLRADSTWAGLSEAQRERLEGWLLDEGLGYQAVLERAEQEFGVRGTAPSLSRYYQRVARERARKDWAEVKDSALGVKETGLERAELEATAMALLAKRVVLLASGPANRIKELGSLARVLVAAQGMELRRRRLELLVEANEMEVSDWMEKARRKGEWDKVDSLLEMRERGRKEEVAPLVIAKSDVERAQEPEIADKPEEGKSP